MSKLIIVAGLAGTGKTTLASKLSETLRITSFHKDSIKEKLFDSLNLSTLEDSQELGTHSINLLFGLAEEHLSKGMDLIIEGPLYFEEDYKIFHGWQKKYDIQIYSIICQIPIEIRKERFRNRPRHRAHHDADRVYQDRDESVYENLPGNKTYITTDRPVEELIETIIKNL